jgi:hypothetical protein
MVRVATAILNDKECNVNGLKTVWLAFTLFTAASLSAVAEDTDDTDGRGA